MRRLKVENSCYASSAQLQHVYKILAVFDIDSAYTRLSASSAQEQETAEHTCCTDNNSGSLSWNCRHVRDNARKGGQPDG
jgi:hypothetical protein